MIIDVQNISMEYSSKRKNKVIALDNVSYSIEQGERVGLIGLNGAGKSTTIKLLTGIMKPTKGNIMVMDKEPYKCRKKICRDYGVMFGQRSQLWWDLPVKDSFYVNGSIYRMSKREVENKILFYKEWFNIEYFNTPVRQLSLGQRITCDILLSSMHDPKILFLDEATIALDVFNRRKVLEMISKINKELNTTIILTSHQLDDIECVCDRVLLLNKGKLHYDGKINQFLSEAIFPRIINIKTPSTELLRLELLPVINKYCLQMMQKGYELSLFCQEDQTMIDEIVHLLSVSKMVDSFNIRSVTLEERLLLMEG